MKKDAQISVRLPTEMLDQLKELAAADRRSLNSFILLALENQLKIGRSEKTSKSKR